MKNIIDKQTNAPTEKTGNTKPDQDKTCDYSEPLSVCTIREITGIQDEDLIHAILVSGASKREIQQAYDHCHGVYNTKLISRKPMTERAKNLSDLIELSYDDMD